jgi:hypothetical protein
MATRSREKQPEIVRYQLTSATPGDGPNSARGPGKLHRLKSGIAAFLALSVAIGIFLAAIALGSLLAVAITILVLLTVTVWLVRGFWHRNG